MTHNSISFLPNELSRLTQLGEVLWHVTRSALGFALFAQLCRYIHPGMGFVTPRWALRTGCFAISVAREFAGKHQGSWAPALSLFLNFLHTREEMGNF